MDKPPSIQSTPKDPILRTTKVLPQIDLKLLFQLYQKQPWLESKESALLELWDLCEKSSEKLLLKDLLSRFIYLNDQTIQENLCLIQKQITDIWKFTPINTQLVGIEELTRSDSSKAIIWWLKHIFAEIPDWNKNNFVVSIGQAPHRISNGVNLIFIDDFSGTGKKIIRQLKWFKEAIHEKSLSEINIKVCCVAAMEGAKNEILKAGYDFYSPILLKKGISDHYTDQALDDAKMDMLRLESTLGNISKNAKKNFPFGRGQAEALYGMVLGNVPNNVFPIFWWNYLKNSKWRSTLFRRLP